ncbi:metal-dependent hydrolase [Flavobacterium sp. FZUC8N2.13]|uniref:Metal-dependent hydrolase n=1 Tax=Flavobacterium zubiriense TaxID=3138075 RepID=A0ABV4TBH6_9FLAO
MDSFTQVLLGIATAELCAGKKLQRKTFLYGAILGTVPDLDVVIGQFLNPVDGLAIHRGMSHSVLFFLLLSPCLGWLITKIERDKINFGSATKMVFWCLLTHVLLDIFTSWGTQVFWPFPDRIALKTIFVIDPLYTIPLLICLILAWRKKDDFFSRKKCVLTSIYLSSFYLLITCSLKLYALQQFDKALKVQNIAYDDLIVKPTAFNCILWNANVATKDAYFLGDYSLLDTQPISFKKYPKNNNLTRQLEGNSDFKKLRLISEGWFIITKNENQFYFNDLRFGLLTSDSEKTQFAFSYVFKEENGVLKAQEVPKRKRDGMALMKNVFMRLKGN